MTFLLRADGLFQAKTNCALSRRRGLLWAPCRQGSPVGEKQEFPGCSIPAPFPITSAHLERSGPAMLTISKRPVLI